MKIKLLSKFHLIAKIVLFSIFFVKFFDHVFTHALKIFQKTCVKTANFFNQNEFPKKSIVLLALWMASSQLFGYELAVMTMFRDEANYLKEWIEYHKMLGVDHFFLYNDRSQDHWQEVLQPYIDSGLVEVFAWDKDNVTPLFPTWQIMAYKDALRRALDNTKWMAFIDVDEFILPMKNKTILECLAEHYQEATGVYICWRNFGTSFEYIEAGKPILTRLTWCIPSLHPKDAAGKSIVKVSAVDINSVWSPHHLVLKVGDQQYFDGSGRPLFFKGGDLIVSPFHTSDLIRINHYSFRDENFYRNIRIPRALSREYGEITQLTDYYNICNSEQDLQMIEFLQNKK